MNPNVLRRFITLMFVAVLVVATFTIFYDSFVDRPPGDFEVEKGDIHLRTGEWEEALEDFNAALKKTPNHRGALMGRAVVFIQLERYDEAVAELDHLITFLEETLAEDDATGRGTLAAAYANRGIVHDRSGRHRVALDDYLAALRVDAGAVKGPGLIDRILYDPTPSTIRKRAKYLYEQFQLPESERVLTVPELDAEERMYKP